MPFQSHRLDDLEKYALVCQFLTLYSGLFFINEETTALLGHLFAVLVVTINGGFAIFCFGSYLLYGKSAQIKKIFMPKGSTGKAKLSNALKKVRTEALLSKLSGKELMNFLPVLLHVKCTYCGVEASRRPVRICGTCKEAFYCSNSCQNSHWRKGHAKECKRKINSPFDNSKTTKKIVPKKQTSAAAESSTDSDIAGTSKMVHI